MCSNRKSLEVDQCFWLCYFTGDFDLLYFMYWNLDFFVVLFIFIFLSFTFLISLQNIGTDNKCLIGKNFTSKIHFITSLEVEATVYVDLFIW